MLDALYPGRFDLGLGRSAQRRKTAVTEASSPSSTASEAVRVSSTGSEASSPSSTASEAAPVSSTGLGATPAFSTGSGAASAVSTASGSGAVSSTGAEAREVDGLLIPEHFDFTALATSPRAALFGKLLKQPGAEPLDLEQVVDDIQTLIAGQYTDGLGNEAHAVPGENADLELWILGSSGGESARVAGARGLPFAANYHVAPAKVLEAVDAYRAAFRPSKVLSAPHVMVSADVVVAEDDATAERLAIPYGLWVRSIRNGTGAIPFPSVEEALAHEWTGADRELVADRLDTQFVGTPRRVAERLETLRRVTGADELLVTTITHEHTDRVRSFELLARHWQGH
ncbi:LLM class flavin-dependent oxidoreductase [Actinoplanes sp. LDG1-06]|uniref:LLM class flavin-dependent oxidoreductase n=1 Tax=Paractinoplanes ovalisporus TaxID=2810368 RepID=A0ABS2AET7_9ACTN|nr:LLM class flavin-dependent oxidoreductase [Actinoplanes ovalisporus]